LLKIGQILGILSGINLTSNLSFIGQYAVRPQYQGLGIGSALWKRVMGNIGTERNISLFSDISMFDKYRVRSGFSVVPEKRIHFYVGKVNCDHLIKQLDGVSLVRINQYNINAVSQYDKQICDGLDRRQLIEEYCKTSETVCLAALNIDNHQIIGYCIITATNFNTATVEPLYADDERIAELLIVKCCELLPIEKYNGIWFQCWDSNEKAIALAKKMGLNFSDKEPILFTKHLVEGKVKKIYCVSSRAFYPF
jgi:hypothetical protein